jgi:hypothetical protein
VIAVSAAWELETVPEALAEVEVPHFSPGEPGSSIIDPFGDILVEVPTKDGEAIITAEVSLEAVMNGRLVRDIAGHYSRPDVLQLHINRRRLERLVESDSIDRSVIAPEFRTARSDSARGGEPETENTG